MNRFFRRLRRFGKSHSAKRSQGLIEPAQQDVPSARAKSSRHKKSTADHWNQ